MKQKFIKFFLLFSLVGCLPLISANEQQQSVESSSDINSLIEQKCDICSADISTVSTIDDTLEHQTRGCKSKCFCQVCASSISVSNLLAVRGTLSVLGAENITGSLTVNGVDLSSATSIGAALAAAGAGSGALAYGLVYSLTQPATVAIGAPILFDQNGPLLGITHTPPSPVINVVSAGTYAITFSVSGLQANQFGISVNGALPTPSTIYGSGAGTQQNTGFTILTLGAGDSIQIVNYSSNAAVSLQTLAGGTQANVLASVYFLRLA